MPNHRPDARPCTWSQPCLHVAKPSTLTCRPASRWRNCRCPPLHVLHNRTPYVSLSAPGADTLLGPEMRSTGEVMGIDKEFASAFAKAQIAAGQRLPKTGKVRSNAGQLQPLP